MRFRPLGLTGQNRFTGFPQRCFSDIGVKYWYSFDVDTECPKTGSNAINFRGN